jgi:hypothetical protein
VKDSIKENEDYYRGALTSFLGAETAQNVMLTYAPREIQEAVAEVSIGDKFRDILDGQR